MPPPTTRVFRRACRAATLTTGELAAALSLHRNTLRRYLTKEPPSAPATARLTQWLREHATRLLDYAQALEQKGGT